MRADVLAGPSQEEWPAAAPRSAEQLSVAGGQRRHLQPRPNPNPNPDLDPSPNPNPSPDPDPNTNPDQAFAANNGAEFMVAYYIFRAVKATKAE